MCQELWGSDPYSTEKSYNFSVPQIMSEQMDEVDCIIFFSSSTDIISEANVCDQKGLK